MLSTSFILPNNILFQPIAFFSNIYNKFFLSSVIGIDLGTTNSCVAIMEGDSPKVIENIEGKKTTPSIVSYTKDGKILVGENAKKQLVLNPGNTFYDVKRLIGRNYDDKDVQNEKKNLPYTIERAKDGSVKMKINGLEKKGYKYTNPIEISSLILKKMKNTAERFLGKTVKDAVVTVPAYFSERQRQATKEAGKYAGLNVLRIINEPTAAAIAFGIGRGQKNILKSTKPIRIAVYDLGGGTFDVSVLECSDGVFEVLATGGNTRLGGKDFDLIIQKYILNLLYKEYGINRNDLSINDIERIREYSEKAKIDLTYMDKCNIYIPNIYIKDNKTPIHFKYELYRQQYNNMVKHLIEQTMTHLSKTISSSGLSVFDVEYVLLIGGMTRMPLIRSTVKSFFNGIFPRTDIDPDLAVANGASIQGYILGGGDADIVLVDVTSLSLGIETMGGIFNKIIPKNTSIPNKNTQVFSTAVDNQDTVIIKVYEGESEFTKDAVFVGQVELSGIPLMPRGKPKVYVTFEINADGIVDVFAYEAITGKKVKTRIKADIKSIEKKMKGNAKAKI